MKIGQQIKFIVELPIGHSGTCKGVVKRILPQRNQYEGPAYIVGDIVEDGQEMADYRIDTEPDGSVSDGTTIIGRAPFTCADGHEGEL